MKNKFSEYYQLDDSEIIKHWNNGIFCFDANVLLNLYRYTPNTRREYSCNACHGTLFSTDALRLHELMNPIGSSGEMYGQIKETFKKLQLIHVLRSIEKKDDYRLFRDLGFFIEGCNSPILKRTLNC